MKKKRGGHKKSVSKPQGVVKLLTTGVKKPNTDSLRGREAGTSTRSPKGVQVGSKARRKKPVPKQGVMAGPVKKRVSKKKAKRY